MMSRKIIPVATVSVSVNYIRYLICFKYTLVFLYKISLWNLINYVTFILLRRIKISILIKTAFACLTFISG